MNAEPFRPLPREPLGPEWQKIGYLVSAGSAGNLGVMIFVTGAPADMTGDEAWAIQKQCQPVHELLEAMAWRRDPKRPEQALRNGALLACFPDPIFVEAIPNAYCSRPCCEHLPWFVVTTKIGRFKIGWRKRVISIDYAETIVRTRAEDLFGDRTMTRFEMTVHASDLEDARAVISRIIAAGQVAPT
jgi:hypothetical protein